MAIIRPGFHPPIVQAAGPGKVANTSNTTDGAQHAEAPSLVELERKFTCRDNAGLAREVMNALELESVPQAHQPKYQAYANAMVQARACMTGACELPGLVYKTGGQGSRAFLTCVEQAGYNPTQFTAADRAHIEEIFNDTLGNQPVSMEHAHAVMLAAIEEVAAAQAATPWTLRVT